MQAARGADHAALGKDAVEDQEEVQIEGGEAHER
jgi:hypothetical protein